MKMKVLALAVPFGVFALLQFGTTIAGIAQ
jgi:hypothetical protein